MLDRLQAQNRQTEATLTATAKLAQFKYDPIGYFEQVLRVRPWSTQREILQACVEPPFQVAIGSGHNFGKSWLGGGIVNWRYDCWGGITATTAPKQESIVDILWKEVRLMRDRIDPSWGVTPDFIGPSAPEMKRAEDWWAKGYVASKGEAFKGRHVPFMAFLFDEAIGLAELYYRATKTMFQPGGDHLWLLFFNPTDITSPLYQELHRRDSPWRTFNLSSLDHPNITGAEEYIPGAVTIEQVTAAVNDFCEPCTGETEVTDIEWPPGSGQWWRPGPEFQSDWLGLWPSESMHSVWGDALWKAASEDLDWSVIDSVPILEVPRIGGDCAWKGDDKTTAHVVWGIYSVHHETHSKIDPVETASMHMELAREWAEKCTERRLRYNRGLPVVTEFDVPIQIDDDGIGGGALAILMHAGYNVTGVGASTRALDSRHYPNKRSELWFTTAYLARKGLAKFGLLSRKVRDELGRQFKAPQYQRRAGMREVEPKEKTKERLGRSPDDADGANLAYYEREATTPESVPNVKRTIEQRAAERREGRESPTRRLFGR